MVIAFKRFCVYLLAQCCPLLGEPLQQGHGSRLQHHAAAGSWGCSSSKLTSGYPGKVAQWGPQGLNKSACSSRAAIGCRRSGRHRARCPHGRACLPREPCHATPRQCLQPVGAQNHGQCFPPTHLTPYSLPPHAPAAAAQQKPMAGLPAWEHMADGCAMQDRVKGIYLYACSRAAAPSRGHSSHMWMLRFPR